MRSRSTLALVLSLTLAGIGCAGSQKEADTTPDGVVAPAALSADECNAMIDHQAALDDSLDKDASLASCTASGTREQHDCVMAAQDRDALAACSAAEPTAPVEPTDPADPVEPQPEPDGPAEPDEG